MLDLLQTLGPTAGVVVVVLLFLKHLSAERAAQQRTAVRVERIVSRNTVANARMTAALVRVESVLLQSVQVNRREPERDHDAIARTV